MYYNVLLIQHLIYKVIYLLSEHMKLEYLVIIGNALDCIYIHKIFLVAWEFLTGQSIGLGGDVRIKRFTCRSMWSEYEHILWEQLASTHHMAALASHSLSWPTFSPLQYLNWRWSWLSGGSYKEGRIVVSGNHAWFWWKYQEQNPAKSSCTSLSSPLGFTFRALRCT